MADASAPDVPAAPDPPERLLQGRFDGRLQFQQCVRAAIEAAAREGWREIVVSDADFADWPLGERSVCADLQAWAKAGRRFVMLAGRYDEVQLRHARFVSWRTHWSHVVECRSHRHADPQDFPSALYSPHWAMRRLDVTHCIGVAGREPERRVQVREALAEWLRRSAPAFPPSVLGL